MSRRFPRLSWWSNPRIRNPLLIAVLALGAFGLSLGLGAWTRVCAGEACPSIAGLQQGEFDPQQASKVYAADGRLITELGYQRRTVVPLSQMAPAVKAAFVVTEDRRFYQHHGVDYWRVLGAIKANILSMRFAQGFSTITMQLARNLFQDQINGRDRTISRKLREAQVAFEIEKNYSKDRILELYLNQIELGNGAFGVEAAAQRYFGKSVREVNVAEAAMLAALPKAPTLYNPRRYPRRAVMRRNLVINLLRDAGYLTSQEAERWKAYPLVLSSRSDYSDIAPYFVEYVRQQLVARFGPEIYREGYRIYTTLDLDVQQADERSLAEQLDKIEEGQLGPYHRTTYAQYLQRKEQSGSQEGPVNSPYLQGLAVTLEAKTGHILAMVGGRDFNDNKFNRAIQARRQAGSTFKPFVYSAAIRAGYPLSRIMVDEPLSVPSADTTEPPWEPQNYDSKFEGPMTLREALYRSRNTVAVRLGMELGPEAVISEATRFGITTKIPPYPSIYIGSAALEPLELIAAYTPFATQGIRTTPIGILRVEDKDGNIVWQPQEHAERVMDREQAWLITDVLRDVVRRGTAYSATTGSGWTIPAGGKTGTTNDNFDVWFIGFTPDLVTGVWMGMDQPEKIMPDAQGGRLAAPAWTAMMKEIYERRPVPQEWPRPDGLTFDTIDKSTGYRYTPFCPKEDRYVESFIPGTGPTEFCPIHNPFAPGAGQNQPFDPGPRQP